MCHCVSRVAGFVLGSLSSSRARKDAGWLSQKGPAPKGPAWCYVGGMTHPDERVWTLTVFLLNDTVDAPEEALKPGIDTEVHNVQIDEVQICKLFVQQTRNKPPKWIRFLEGAATPPIRTRNRSSAAVLFVKQKDRIFVVTFGFGRYLLRPGSWEEGFGLRVTLNSIDPRKIRSVDHKKFEAITRHTRTQTNIQGSTSDFGIDVEQDLVRAVTGEPRNSKWGKRLTGMDALAATAQLHLEALPRLLGRFLERYRADDYKENFGWIDHIGEVRDVSLRSRLDDTLIRRLSAKELDKLWLALPEMIEWSEISGFCYSGRFEELKEDVHLRDFLEAVPSEELTLQLLKRRTIRAMDVAEEHVRYEWHVYQCVYFECELDDDTYILASGKWYRISTDFLETVNGTVARLARTTPKLPRFDPGTDNNESEYNERVARENPDDFALLDRDLVSYGGTRLEVCDLFSSKREFIHVKRYGGSSAPLSHLFAQGLNSATAWLADADYRDAANALLPDAFQIERCRRRPDPSEYTVIFAVVSRSKKAIEQSLPFFSRLSLRNAARQLQSVGYQVALVKIAT